MLKSTKFNFFLILKIIKDKFQLKEGRKGFRNERTKRNYLEYVFQDQKVLKESSDGQDYINEVTAIFDGFLNELKEQNKDIIPKKSDGTITIYLILKSSIYGLEKTDLEKKFYTEVLTEWAKGAFPSINSDIKFNIKMIDDTDKLKEEVSSFLYVKSPEYDIIMLDIVWIGQFKNFLLNIQNMINSNTTYLYQTKNLKSCKSGTELVALVCFKYKCITIIFYIN